MFLRHVFVVPAVFCLLLGASFATPVGAQPMGPKLNEFTSAHFDMTVKVDARNVSQTITGIGDFEVDRATRTFKLQMQLGAMGQTIEMVMIDGQIYFKAPNEPWRVMNAGEFSMQNRAMINMAPPQQLTNMERIAQFQPLGQETVDGTPTTKWAMTVNTQQLADFFMMYPGMMGGAMQGAGQIRQEQMVELFRNARFNGELWVANDTGFLRRLRFDMTFTIPPSMMNQGQVSTAAAQPTEIHEEITMTFSRFNQPVTIVAPSGAVPLNLPPPGAAVAQTSAPRPGQTAPMTQLPRGMLPAGTMQPGMTLPRTMPRTGDLPAWPLAGLGLLLVALGFRCRSALTPRSRQQPTLTAGTIYQAGESDASITH